MRVIGILKKQDNAITSRTARQKTALMLLSRKYAMQIEYSKTHTQYCNRDLITELVRVVQLAVIKDFLSVGLMLIFLYNYIIYTTHHHKKKNTSSVHFAL